MTKDAAEYIQEELAELRYWKEEAKHFLIQSEEWLRIAGYKDLPDRIDEFLYTPQYNEKI